MHFLLFPVGSAGDVHPFLGLALRLRERGHRCTVLTNTAFEALTQRLGFDFVPLARAEDFEETLRHPDLWHPTRAFALVAREAILPNIRPTYEAIRERYRPGETVVVAGSLSFGARVAQEQLGVPTASVHLQPSLFRTSYRMPRLGGVKVPDWAPRWAKRGFFWVADRFAVDPLLVPPLNAFRAELGLAPIRRPLDMWWHSPQLILAMFPEWFAAPQPDWPAQAVLTGFPLYDERGATEAPEEFRRFVAAGSPPVVFTPGSAMAQGHKFFAAALTACQALKRRAVFLTRFPEQLPKELPPDVRHFDFIPLSEALAHAAALVHHGGIGTCAQGLRAGVPQLVMAMSHDQPDNAERLEPLGVARWLSPGTFTPDRVARALGQLLSSPDVARSCRAVAERFVGADGLDRACVALEAMTKPGGATE